MQGYTITSETILSTKSNLEKETMMEAMKEFTGVKIIEAVDLLLKDFSQEQKDQLMSRIDIVIDRVLYMPLPL
jgi:hypothetical protein